MLVGAARSEGLLLALAAAFEEAAQVRKPPSVVNPSLFRPARRIPGHWVSSVARCVVPGSTSTSACGTPLGPPGRARHRLVVELAAPQRRRTPHGRRVEVPLAEQQGRVAEVALRLHQRLEGQVADELVVELA